MATAPAPRLEYLDRLRGLAVLIMIDAHVFDAWTRLDDRDTWLYHWAIVIGGYAAPLFLFLVGVGIALAAGKRERQGQAWAATAARILRRGGFILALAYLFRLQAWLISGGAFERALLKVDILNVMGVSMLCAAAVWRTWGGPSRGRAWPWVAASGALVLAVPWVYGWDALTPLPDGVEGYIRPSFGRTSFAIVPWTAFVLLGVVAGAWLDAGDDEARSRGLRRCAAAGAASLAVAAVLAVSLDFGSDRSIWAYSRTFFLMRLGIVLLLVPVAWAWTRRTPGWSPLRVFGEASLFVYWIHVELAYGTPSGPLHRSLPVGLALAGWAGVVLLMYGLVRLRDQVAARRPSPSAAPGLEIT